MSLLSCVPSFLVAQILLVSGSIGSGRFGHDMVTHVRGQYYAVVLFNVVNNV